MKLSNLKISKKDNDKIWRYLEFWNRENNFEAEPNYEIQCNHCHKKLYVGHLSWDILVCPECKDEVINNNPE